MTVWIFMVVALIGASASVALARRLVTPRTYVSPRAEFGPVALVDQHSADLRTRIRRIESWALDVDDEIVQRNVEARHISSLLLELRLSDAEMREDGERELGDLRRIVSLIANRLDRLEAARPAAVSLDAEVESLGHQLNIAIRSFSSRLDRFESDSSDRPFTSPDVPT